MSRHIRIILVDDGSSDESSNICNQYADKNENISVIHSKNHGVSHARNLGIKASEGYYIFFVDSDDYVLENYILEMMEYEEADYIGTGYKKCYDNGCYSECKITEQNLLLSELKQQFVWMQVKFILLPYGEGGIRKKY